MSGTITLIPGKLTACSLLLLPSILSEIVSLPPIRNPKTSIVKNPANLDFVQNICSVATRSTILTLNSG